MARFLVQHGSNDRGIAFEEGSGVTRLRVVGQFTSLTDSGSDASGTTVSVAQFGSGLIKGRLNGRTTTPPQVSTTEATTSNGSLTIGASGATTEFTSGSLRHLLITQGCTPHEIMQLEGWLLWNIGRPDLLAGDHPYRNIRP